MILSLLIILWLIIGTMTACSLFYKNYQNNQILGVTLSKEHANTLEVQEIIKRFKKACYLILLLFLGLSLLLLLDNISSYGEFYMLILIIANLFVNWLFIHHYEQQLLLVKKKNKWAYQRAHVVTVDLNVTKEKGKSSVSVLWSWGFFALSFIPSIYLLLNTKAQGTYPLLLSLIGPLTQLSTIYLYHKMRYQHTLVLSDNSETNKACAEAGERINTTAATLSGLTMLVFWILFSLSIIHTSNELFTALPVVLLVSVMLIIARWQQKSIRNIESSLSNKESLGDDEIYEQESTWKWGFYYNPSDPRIMVPKRIANMGWTINIGNPIGKILGFGIYALILVILLFVIVGGAKDYKVTQIGTEIKIDAAMYDITVQKDQVASVSVIDSIPNGARTNGYGGIDKSFGHFSLNGYGKCMLYVYNKVDRYIIIQLKDDNPSYVIVNDKSVEKTDELYQSLNKWAED